MRKFREPKPLRPALVVAFFYLTAYPAPDMSPYLNVLTGRRNAQDAWEIVDLRGRVLNRSTINPLAWGPGATFEQLRETAATIVYHSGVRWPGMAVVERFGLDVVSRFDPQYGFSITDTAVADWLAENTEAKHGR